MQKGNARRINVVKIMFFLRRLSFVHTPLDSHDIENLYFMYIVFLCISKFKF